MLSCSRLRILSCIICDHNAHRYNIKREPDIIMQVHEYLSSYVDWYLLCFVDNNNVLRLLIVYTTQLFI